MKIMFETIFEVLSLLFSRLTNWFGKKKKTNKLEEWDFYIH